MFDIQFQRNLLHTAIFTTKTTLRTIKSQSVIKTVIKRGPLSTNIEISTFYPGIVYLNILKE